MQHLSVKQTATRAEVNVPICPPVLGKYIPIRVALSVLSQISDQHANPICRVEGDGSASTIPATTVRFKPVATVGHTRAAGRACGGRPYANALDFLLVVSTHECGEESPNSIRLPGTVGSASMRISSKILSPFTLTFFDSSTDASTPGPGNTSSSVILEECVLLRWFVPRSHRPKSTSDFGC